MTKPASTPILAAITTLPVIVAFFAFAAPAVAEPITYTVQGTASGTLDDIPFTSYTISLAGDTNNIVQPNPSVPNFVNPFAPGTATVTVTGKTDTLPDVFAFVNGRNPPLGPLTGYAGFSFGQGGFITQTISTAFDSYKLGAIGSTPGDTFTSFTSSGLGGLTTGSGGTFTFTNTVGALGTATFDADVVPLPAALPLFATGLGALGLLGWRRKRKARAVA